MKVKCKCGRVFSNEKELKIHLLILKPCDISHLSVERGYISQDAYNKLQDEVKVFNENHGLIS